MGYCLNNRDFYYVTLPSSEVVGLGVSQLRKSLA